MEAKEIFTSFEANFEHLVTKYETQIYYLALQLVGDLEQCEQVLGETFITYHARFDGTVNDSSLIELCKLAVTLSKEKSANTQETPFALPKEILLSSPESRGPGEKRILLEYAVSKLPWQYKTAFVLSDVVRLSAEEISEVMTLTTSEVESLLKRARVLVAKTMSRPALEEAVINDTYFQNTVQNKSELLQ